MKLAARAAGKAFGVAGAADAEMLAALASGDADVVIRSVDVRHLRARGVDARGGRAAVGAREPSAREPVA